MVMPLCSDGVNDMFTESKVHHQKYQYVIYYKKSPEDRLSLSSFQKHAKRKTFALYPRLVRVVRWYIKHDCKQSGFRFPDTQMYVTSEELADGTLSEFVFFKGDSDCISQHIFDNNFSFFLLFMKC